ncbi:uncharacterized protein [Lolium perenne]|uniref:uncharacterized protein n=1 Tax=Lolium perenne TaxID=4522 RepID=UPI003A99484E
MAATTLIHEHDEKACGVAEGNDPVVHHEINVQAYNKAYYLEDGLYPNWFTLVKTIRAPEEEKKRFVKQQDAYMKDLKWTFGVLQSWWAIVPARTWSIGTMWEVITACVIMHTMIVENERDEGLLNQG